MNVWAVFGVALLVFASLWFTIKAFFEALGAKRGMFALFILATGPLGALLWFARRPDAASE